LLKVKQEKLKELDEVRKYFLKPLENWSIFFTETKNLIPAKISDLSTQQPKNQFNPLQLFKSIKLSWRRWYSGETMKSKKKSKIFVTRWYQHFLLIKTIDICKYIFYQKEETLLSHFLFCFVLFYFFAGNNH